ncbi:hypothetical protein D0T90_04510 [Neisseria animalis]|uniref:Uncharacterized protein n=1 Tax=Neisseria animalis TaxID=492 RepID=A0A5P3MRX9_NEIAN|nr:hypothetical protein D0T90_04510 [Neisseria animalis]ROW32077.1 hypothetical protein CGZ60_07025 [Neisseria animalis]
MQLDCFVALCVIRLYQNLYKNGNGQKRRSEQVLFLCACLALGKFRFSILFIGYKSCFCGLAHGILQQFGFAVWLAHLEQMEAG